MHRAIAQIAQAFQRDHLPLSPALRLVISRPSPSTREPTEQAPPPQPSADFLEARRAVLCEAPLEARQAMAAWADAEQRHADRSALPFAAAHAVEMGAWMLPALTRNPAEEPQPDNNKASEALEHINQMARDVKKTARQGLFPEPPADLSESSARGQEGAHLPDQLKGISLVIRHQHGFKIKPFEWLYHGLEPLLLPDVLTKKWGIPLTLSVVYTCVALRLGVPLMPHKVRHTPPDDDATARALAEAQQAHGLATSIPPTPDAWLLHPAAQHAHPHAAFLEPASGRVLSGEQCQALHPHHDAALTIGHPQFVWAEFLRVAVLAHQRRGDGDAVAHCLYQLLSLDLYAPEWASMLTARP